MEIMNRFYIVKKNPELSTGLFFWASIGQCLENLFRVFSEREKGYLLRALGNLTGLAQVITHIPSRGVK
jgi:hypothetical protein